MTDGIWADIYVLTKKRNPALIFGFLNEFLPGRIETADEYEIPRYSSSPTRVFDKADALIQYCCSHQDVEQAVYYWSNESENEPRSAMIFFTEDGHLILGLSTDASSLEDHYLTSLIDFCDSQVGYIAYESPPEMTEEAFRLMASNYNRV
jgi:hypothetical protein